MKSAPLLSVVIPTRNYGRFLACAIGSVLAQGFPSVEIIVADDGSVDDTAEVAASFGDRVKYFFQPNAGTASARNLGLRHATGGFIGFLDSDDAWVPGTMAPLLEALRNDGNADAIHGMVSQVNDTVFSAALAAPADWKSVAVPCWLAGGILFRRAVFDKSGPFGEDKTHAEFVQWISAARDNGLKFRYHPDLILFRRIHGANKVLDPGILGRELTRVARMHLDRLRNGGNNQGMA
jgi:glycosyltransferase involved in cell wall biosynthesis